MKQQGFTLIELMIATGIVAVLTAIAVPSYLSYTMRANRTDATRSLTSNAQALERCYSQQFAYAPCTTATVSLQGYYNITLTTVAATSTVGASYTLQAIAGKAPQTNDSSCHVFTLDSTGKQGAADTSSSNTTQTCWGST